MLRLLHQKAGYLGNFDRNTEAETLKDSLCFRYVPPSKRNRVRNLFFFSFFLALLLNSPSANKNHKFNLGD